MILSPPLGGLGGRTRKRNIVIHPDKRSVQSAGQGGWGVERKKEMKRPTLKKMCIKGSLRGRGHQTRS